MATYRAKLGPYDPYTLIVGNSLVYVLHAQGKHAEAEAMYGRIKTFSKNVFGDEQFDKLIACTRSAETLRAQGNHADAEAKLRSLLDIMEHVPASGHPYRCRISYYMALGWASQGEHVEALVFARRALQGWRETLGEKHPDTKMAENLLRQLEQSR